MPESAAAEGADAAARRTRRGRGRGGRAARRFLGTMRIRKKIFLLHTAFSGVLAALLFFALRPAIQDLLRQAEAEDALFVLATLDLRGLADGRAQGERTVTGDAVLRWGSAGDLSLRGEDIARLQQASGAPVPLPHGRATGAAGVYVPHAAGAGYYVLERRLEAARASVARLDLILLLSLLGLYTLVAAALEIFVLPRNVYEPIRLMLQADRAVQRGHRDDELIDERMMPEDELGEIMRSRNRSIAALRRNERKLASTLEELERVAGDLKRKNHLLENARRNLADADRLASLGMLSAGIAHEINTPLAVVKGLVHQLRRHPEKGVEPATADLMKRVVDRLERLGEGLLDFARVRSPAVDRRSVAALVTQALELLSLDESVQRVAIADRTPADLALECDGDRIVQVLVNLVRNAAEALVESGTAAPAIAIDAETLSREDSDWVSITVSDNGPGIPADIMATLFEPFVSTRLDAKGSGLGLAVADGIVREHRGVLVARNLGDRRAGAPGAQFEILLPAFAGAARSGRGDAENAGDGPNVP